MSPSRGPRRPPLRRGQLPDFAERLRRAAEFVNKRHEALDPVSGGDDLFLDPGFWGRTWYDHLERAYPSPDLLERARKHVERGALTHLRIARGHLVAVLTGAARYGVEIAVQPPPPPGWAALRELCARERWFRWELVQGTPEAFRRLVARAGFLPSPAEMSHRCACLNRRHGICEHAAAALYGVGTRMADSPEEFFRLRGVDFDRLATGDIEGVRQAASGKTLKLDADGLGDLFGVAVEPESDPLESEAPPVVEPPRTVRPGRPGRTLFDGH